MLKYRLMTFALVAVFASGCGSAAIPTEQMTAAEAAIRAAEVGGAPEHPGASLQLKHARDQVEAAKRYIAEEDNERALWVLRRAEVDAELALAMARENTTQAQAKAALEEVESMKRKAAQ